MGQLKYKIVVDTREQKPLWKECADVERGTLKTGDYSIKGFENKFAIERKSLSDLYGTLGGGNARFKKELERARTLDYFAIIIEGCYTNCVNKRFEGANYSKMRGPVITSIVFTLHMKYGINVFFTNGRIETKHITRELMTAYWKLHEKEFFGTPPKVIVNEE